MAYELGPTGVGGIIAGVAGAIGGVVTAVLEHRGKFVRLRYERDAATEERDRLQSRVTELERLLFGRVNNDTPINVSPVPTTTET